MPSCTLRIARPTNDLSVLVKFYTTALGLTIWHLEFTHRHGETVDRAPTKEHLLVFYVKENEEWEKAVKRMEDAGGVKVKSENPWWDACGATYEDPDGYRVVLQNSGWR
jgi:catechol 2,3-dioxygenase-like lactoylglutathione lyase family enzyme